MFGGSKKSAPNFDEKIDTLIGKNTILEGTITGGGTIRIDGKLKGELSVSGNLVVGEEGSILGNVKADNIHCAGIIDGNVEASSQLHLTSSSRLNGDIVVKNIVIDEGAVFTGNCRMLSAEMPKLLETPED